MNFRIFLFLCIGALQVDLQWCAEWGGDECWAACGNSRDSPDFTCSSWCGSRSRTLRWCNVWHRGRLCCKCHCFPATARLTLDNGKSVMMSELQKGDRVQTGMD